MTHASTTEAPTILETIDGGDLTTSTGIFPQADGTFLVMTHVESKTLKTRKGAERWLRRRLEASVRFQRVQCKETT